MSLDDRVLGGKAILYPALSLKLKLELEIP